MKKSLILILFMTTNIFSQVVFDTGYFINKSNEKISCLIKNVDWLNNPTQFQYKLNEEGELRQESISNVSEFAVNEKVKFLRKKVDLDVSSNDLNNLDDNRKPNFISKEVFLRVLVEGEASLFSYKGANEEKFFYSKDTFSVKSLVHKLFLMDIGKVSHNNSYKQELLNNLKCADVKENEIRNLTYKRNKLLDLFISYNSCAGVEFKNYHVKKKKKRDLFNLSLRAGIRNNTFSVKREALDRELDFGSILSYRVGLEAEIVLGFNNNKWSIIIEPTIQNFKSPKINTDLVSNNSITT